ncbi:hypothetical protein MTO96_048442 [Rhipicephalus appendiculatus]|uniref:Phosphatidate phosphatase n=2 Tax=Rhipicephalus TaxID=426455 RepID=A0A131YN53_RHIAP
MTASPMAAAELPSGVVERRKQRVLVDYRSITMPTGKRIMKRVFTYSLILGLLAICVASMRGALMPKTLPGFRCDDPHIRHPFRGDTVTLTQILALVIVLPGPLLFLVEQWADGPVRWPLVRSALRHYVLGLELVSVAIEVVKSLVTKPRPHFLDSCRPDWDKLDCSQGLVTQYQCANEEAWILVDMYKSFPSGHSALGFYLFTFVAAYCAVRLPSLTSRWSRGGCRLLQLCLFVLACACAASRIYDRRHHPVDVVTGGLLGVLGGLATVRWFVSSSRHRIESKAQ